MESRRVGKQGMKEIDIRYGILNPPIHEQLIRQGLRCSKIDHFEKLRESINYLKMAGYIADGTASKWHKKAFDQIFDLLELIKK
jgi:isopropylmalate/homocitrate/citramalate synthase